MKKNKQALSELIKNKISLNFIQGNYSPVMLLAKNKDIEAVEFLIDEFKVNLNDATKGYALGGHVEQVNDLIAQGASRTSAGQGYARAGNVQLVNEQIDQGASIDPIIASAACGKHVDLVNQLLEQGAAINYAVLGYARGGHVEEVDKLLEQGANHNDALQGYSCGGYIEQANKLIQAGADPDYAVRGYSLVGNVEEVDKLLKKGASKDVAVRGYAFGGHVAQVNKLLLEGASLYHAISGYANSGDIEQVYPLVTVNGEFKVEMMDYAIQSYTQMGYVGLINQFLEQGFNRHSMMYGYASGGYINKENILQLMSLTDDDELRKLLASKMKELDLSTDVDDLITQSTKINAIARKYKINYDEARSLTIPNAYTWLADNAKLIKQGRLVEDLYFNISSMLLGLSIHSTKIVFQSVQKYIFGNEWKKRYPFWDNKNTSQPEEEEKILYQRKLNF